MTTDLQTIAANVYLGGAPANQDPDATSPQHAIALGILDAYGDAGNDPITSDEFTWPTPSQPARTAQLLADASAQPGYFEGKAFGDFVLLAFDDRVKVIFVPTGETWEEEGALDG